MYRQSFCCVLSRALGGCGATNEETFNNVRVNNIGGRSGSKIDQLRITFLEKYVTSSVEFESVTMVMGARGEGTFVEFNSWTVLTTASLPLRQASRGSFSRL